MKNAYESVIELCETAHRVSENPVTRAAANDLARRCQEKLGVAPTMADLFRKWGVGT